MLKGLRSARAGTREVMETCVAQGQREQTEGKTAAYTIRSVQAAIDQQPEKHFWSEI